MSYQYKLDCSKGRNLRGMKQTVFKRWNGSFGLVCLFWTCFVSSPWYLILIDVSLGSAAEAMMFASREVILMLAHLIVSYIQCLQPTVLRVFLKQQLKSHLQIYNIFIMIYTLKATALQSPACFFFWFILLRLSSPPPNPDFSNVTMTTMSTLAGWALTAHRAQGASMDEGAVALLRGLFSPGQADGCSVDHAPGLLGFI